MPTSKKIWSAAEMELMTPNERAKIVTDGQLSSLEGLDPDFQERVRAKARKIAEEHGLLNPEPS